MCNGVGLVATCYSKKDSTASKSIDNKKRKTREEEKTREKRKEGKKKRILENDIR